MNRAEKNQLKKIAAKADDFYTGFNNEGINTLLRELFDAIDEWQGVKPPVKRTESVVVINDLEL
jgi:hypothetical protein